MFGKISFMFKNDVIIFFFPQLKIPYLSSTWIPPLWFHPSSALYAGFDMRADKTNIISHMDSIPPLEHQSIVFWGLGKLVPQLQSLSIQPSLPDQP